MKKLILAGLALLLALALVTCDAFTFGQNDDDIVGYTDVVYSKDGSTLTLYLDGVGVPETRAQRALTKDIAEVNHNQFEVVFYYDSNGTTTGGETVARASWVRGDAAAIKGVVRSTATMTTGIDYAATSITGTTETAAAILFVGRRSDKTLLALGKLTGADNIGNGTFTGTTVSPATKAVQFTVVALEAGTELADISNPLSIPAPATSSFLTANVHDTASGTIGNVSAANTTFSRYVISQIPFPIYYLSNPLKTVAATYTILAGSATGYEMADFASGIVAHTDNPTVEVIGVQYLKDGGVSDFDYPARGFTKTNIAVTRSTTAINITDFVFTIPTTAEPGITAFYFENPIVALIDQPSTADATLTPIKWFFRSAYGSNVYNLDDGTKGYGGAILLGIGDTDSLNVVVNSTWQ